MKSVILIIIDALSARHVKAAFEADRLPSLRKLADLGEIHDECISVFPSITPAATASIITGCYPCDHRIPGAFFYDTDQDRIHFFGSDIWAILREGWGKFVNDFLLRLNQEILQAETLYQRVESAGLKSASLNYMIFRGQKIHPVDVPLLLSLLPGVPWQAEIAGPHLLRLGDLISDQPGELEDALSAPGGMFRRFGFHDNNTAALLLKLAEQNALCDLTVAYFPDNDFASHHDGPNTELETLDKLDDHLGDLFAVYGGVESLLAKTAIIITGDHSQSDLIADENARGINVDDLLDDFPLVPAGDSWTNDDQLMVCPNLRACQIYLRRGRWSDLDQIVNQLLADHRIDQVIWQTDMKDGKCSYHVVTRRDGKLSFWRSETGNSRGHDAFGNEWNWEGELAPVGAAVSASGQITFTDYPNALERIASSFAKPAGGDLWVTARLGHEFMLPNTEVHDAGSHGSLHALDSTSPMILAGAPDDVTLPEHLRTIDAADLCLRILGLI